MIENATHGVSGQRLSDQTQQMADAIAKAEEQLGTPPGIFSSHEELTFLVIAIVLAAMQAVAFAVIAYGYVASAVCVLLGPIFNSVLHRPQARLALLGWFKAFLGFTGPWGSGCIGICRSDRGWPRPDFLSNCWRLTLRV